jgi:hypothetical protein
MTSVRGTACLCAAASVLARNSMAQQTAATVVGLELGSEDGLDGTIDFDGDHVCGAGSSECCAETKAITAHAARSVAFDQDLALQDRTDRALRRTME